MLANEGHSNWITVSSLLVRSAGEAIERYGNVNLTEYRVLIYVSHHEGCSVKEVAATLELSPSTVSLALSRLEEMGAVERMYTDADRRVVRLRVTEQGAALLGSVDPAIARLAHEFWAVYSAEELEMTQRDSIKTVNLFGRTHIKDGEVNIETAYVDSAIVVMCKIAREMKRANITLNEYRLLYLLSEASGGMRPSDVARELFLRSSEITLAADKLVRKGYAERSRDPLDKRSNVLSITSVGYDKLKRTTPYVVEVLRTEICPLEDGSFSRYDSIASKIVERQRRHYLMS